MVDQEILDLLLGVHAERPDTVAGFARADHERQAKSSAVKYREPRILSRGLCLLDPRIAVKPFIGLSFGQLDEPGGDRDAELREVGAPVERDRGPRDLPRLTGVPDPQGELAALAEPDHPPRQVSAPLATPLAGEGHEGIDVLEADAPQIAMQPRDRLPEQIPPEDGIVGIQAANIKGDTGREGAREAEPGKRPMPRGPGRRGVGQITCVEDLGRDAREVGIHFVHELGRPPERRDDRGVELGGEERHEHVTRPVAGEPEVAIGAIESIGEPAVVEIRAHEIARHVEERAHDVRPAAGRRGRHRREAARSGPAQEAEEEGLGLVVRGVSDRHVTGPVPLRLGGEKGVADMACSFLEALARRGRDPAEREGGGQPEAAGDLPDEHGVGGRLLAPESVIDVGDDEREPELRGELGEGMHEGHRVRAAGHRDHRPPGCGEEAAAVGRAEDLAKKRVHRGDDMLRPMKIYTRSGDRGDTGLIGGRRVKKNVPRVAAYGGVDELNAVLGLAIAELGAGAPGASTPAADLARIQNALFTLGAELATPSAAEPARGVEPLAAAETTWLEASIDALGDRLPPLSHFILPGGTRAGATLHLARTVCRRAERAIVALAAEEPVRAEVLAYVNRLSDYLFMLARAVNAAAGATEARWLGRAASGPGA